MEENVSTRLKLADIYREISPQNPHSLALGELMAHLFGFLSKYPTDEMFRLYIGNVMRQAFEWDEWCTKIPVISFPSDWKVQITPPYAGAMIRFRVQVNETDGISVYLDCHDSLGWVGKPYWEAYPIQEDRERFDMEDVDGLTACIQQELERRKRED